MDYDSCNTQRRSACHNKPTNVRNRQQQPHCAHFAGSHEGKLRPGCQDEGAGREIFVNIINIVTIFIIIIPKTRSVNSPRLGVGADISHNHHNHHHQHHHNFASSHLPGDDSDVPVPFQAGRVDLASHSGLRLPQPLH